MKYLISLFLLSLAACSSTKYYVVRHAEKATVTRDSAGMMSSNPPLSEAGKVRAFVLRDELKDARIRQIFSTNTIRTVTTAAPLSEHTGIPVQLYSSSKDSVDAFISRIKELKGNTLIVGHSNTVDELVNKLTGRIELPTDLQDGDYDNLFIITRSGKNWKFERKKFGYPSNP